MQVMDHQVVVDPAEMVGEGGVHGGGDEDDVRGHDVVAPLLLVGQGICTEVGEDLVEAVVQVIHGDNSLTLVQHLLEPCLPLAVPYEPPTSQANRHYSMFPAQTQKHNFTL